MMASPYARAARVYFDSGWSPIPLPHKSKSPVPDSPTPFTGAKGAYVDGAQLRKWLAERGRAQAGNLSYPPGNIAIRLPRDIIGIDVDAYGTKKGAETLAKAEEQWGALPRSWVSTSKSDGLSGIRLFRIPEGLSWPGELPQGKGVELLRWDHRYMLVSPSVHDLTGEEYRWCKEELLDGALYLVNVNEFPDADAPDIPALPEEWVDGLTRGKSWEERSAVDDLSASEIQDWLLARPEADKPCSHMRSLITKGKTSIQAAGDDGGAHDTARDVAWGVLNDAKAGHTGVSKALAALRTAFLANVKGRRDSERQAKTEWARIVQRGVAKVDGDDSGYETEDPCESIRTLGAAEDGSAPRMGSGDTFPNDDPGNAARLFRTVNGRARWVPGWGAWAIWTGDRWTLDADGQMDRWAVKTVRDMAQEIALMEGYADEAAIKAQRSFMKASGSEAKLTAMQSVMKTRKGVTVQVSDFDANPNHLAVSNGVLELSAKGVRLLPIAADMYITKNTGLPWQADAAASLGKRAPLWNGFLERFLPDVEVRAWAQRIAGYSLIGSNKGRKIVALIGNTSTGKSTFGEAIRRVLGDYGAVMQASILRGNQDDRARPDLLDAFGRRVIVAEELGEVQELHADQVKRLTGNTPISARGMRSNAFISLTPAFTPWIVANSVPHIKDADRAVERRLLVIPFDQEIDHSEEDLDYTDRMIRGEGAEILAWCVEGYEMWLRDPRLEEIPLGAMAAAQGFREGMNDFNRFCSEKLDFGHGFSAVPAALYQEYQIWCSDNGIKDRDQLSGTKFGTRLSAIGCAKVSKRVKGSPMYVRSGVRILSEKTSDLPT